MAATISFDGYGVKLQIEDVGNPGTFLDAAELLSLTFPDLTKDIIDSTHASSPDKYREKIAGLKDGGEVSAEINYTQTDYELYLAAFELDAATNFKIELPDDNYSTTQPTFAFAAHITGLPGDVPSDDKVTASITLTITGKPVFTAGT